MAIHTCAAPPLAARPSFATSRPIDRNGPMAGVVLRLHSNLPIEGE
jgi:hypothetical protein